VPQPPTESERLYIGPFFMYKTGTFALTIEQLSVLEMIAPTFYAPSMQYTLAAPQRRVTECPSLRIIEWLLSVMSCNQTIHTSADGVTFNIYKMYRSAGVFYKHTKTTFDFNRRRGLDRIPYRIWFHDPAGKVQFTTVAAANFLYTCSMNNIIKFSSDNFAHIWANKAPIEEQRRKAQKEASRAGQKLPRQSYRQTI